ncbi:MAG TPA: ABC transporter permease [Gemmatimonadaceae bacterium]|nr:ABC transporter permease [Gemmatimonadaceae bacterium]
MRSLKFALRTLFKTPFVTAVAVLSLALGIGANAAIFSLFDQLLMRPLPVREPAELVNLSAPGPKPGSQSCSQAGDCDDVFSYAMFRDLEKSPSSFTGIAAHRSFGANLAYRGQTLNGEGMMASGSYFSLLGVAPALGRLLVPSDDETIGANYVAVLSHDYWENRLGSDPGVINQTMVINGHQMTIVGVAPRGFFGTTLGSTPSVFVPISMRGQMEPGFDDFENRRSYWAYLFARLKAGTTLEEAQRTINAVYRPIITEVEAPLQEGMSEDGMTRFRTKEVALSSGVKGQSSVHEEARTPLLMLFSITGIVLLIACANIANLLLARAATRGTEMAVRLSLGASRRQVIGQLLLESCLLALMGGAASLLVAKWTLAGIASILPSQPAAMLHLQLDGTVFWFAAAMSIGTGLLFGMYPAIHATRPDLVSTLRANSGQPSGARAAARFRTSLVTAQIALSMALLISAGLFLKSLSNVSRVDLGLRIDNVVTFGISPNLNGYENALSQQLFARVEEELAALPGVTGVTAAMVPLLAGSNWGSSVSVEGFERGPDIDAGARFNEVGTEFFRTLGVPLLAGREFTTSDVQGSGRVAVVNETFARKFNLGREAVGKWMAQGGPDDSLNIQIVGLVQDSKYSAVKDTTPPLFYTPYRQDESIGFITFYVRTSLPPEQTLRAIPAVIARLDPNLPIENLKTLPQQMRDNVFLDRMISMLSAAFALLATLLAAIGLYGVLAYTVAQRTREIGLRMALGADGARVRTMVLRQVGWMMLIGGVIGIIAAIGLGRAAGSLLFGLEGHDPMVVSSSAILLTIVALGAGYLPALRASRVDPMQALRYE